MSLLKKAALALGLIAGSVSVASANTVVFNYTGTVIQDTGQPGLNGQTATVTLTYDLPPLTSNIHPNSGTGAFAPNSFTVTGSLTMQLGSNTWSSIGNLSVQTRDNFNYANPSNPMFSDSLIVTSNNVSGPDLGNGGVASLRTALNSPFAPTTSDFIDSIGMPETIDIADLATAPFTSDVILQFDNPTRIQLGGFVETAPVPLPAGGWLLLSGLAAAAAAAMARRRAKAA